MALSNGTAQCSVPYPDDVTALGTHQISAAYSGDSTYAPTTTGDVGEQVEMTQTTSTVTRPLSASR